MGLFSFIKEEGRKVFKSHEEERITNPNVHEDLIAQNQKDAVRRYLSSSGLNIAHFDFTLDRYGLLTLTGECASKADYEKVALTAGNIAGVAEVDNNMTIIAGSLVEEAESKFHTVVEGDTLWKIAEKVYKDGTEYQQIFEANKPMLKDANDIYPGQVLRIPIFQ